MAMQPSRKQRKASIITVTVDQTKTFGAEIMQRELDGRSEDQFARRWQSSFGVDAVTCAEVWNRLEIAEEYESGSTMSGAKPYHLLWALTFLKVYSSESEMAPVLKGKKVDEKTFRKWSQLFVELISYLYLDVVCYC